MDNLETDFGLNDTVFPQIKVLPPQYRIPLLKLGEMITFEGLLNDIE